MKDQSSVVAEIIDFALQVPDTDEPRMLNNRVYRFLRDLGQVAWYVIDQRAKRKAAFMQGRAETSGTPAGAHGAKGGK